MCLRVCASLCVYVRGRAAVGRQPVCGFLTRTIRPFLGFITRLIELLNRVRRRLRWREEFGASEESGRCPQLSSVSCLCRPQEPVVFFDPRSSFPAAFVSLDPR